MISGIDRYLDPRRVSAGDVFEAVIQPIGGGTLDAMCEQVTVWVSAECGSLDVMVVDTNHSLHPYGAMLSEADIEAAEWKRISSKAGV